MMRNTAKIIRIAAISMSIITILSLVAYVRIRCQMNYQPESLADFVWQTCCMDRRGEVSNQNVSEAPLGDYVVRTMEICETYGDFLITTIGVESLFGKYFVLTPRDFESSYTKMTAINPYDEEDKTQYRATMTVLTVDDKIIIEVNSDHLFSDNFGEPELIIENDGGYCYPGRYYQYFILSDVPEDYCLKSWIIEFTYDDVTAELDDY